MNKNDISRVYFTHLRRFHCVWHWFTFIAGTRVTTELDCIRYERRSRCSMLETWRVVDDIVFSTPEKIIWLHIHSEIDIQWILQMLLVLFVYDRSLRAMLVKTTLWPCKVNSRLNIQQGSRPGRCCRDYSCLFVRIYKIIAPNEPKFLMSFGIKHMVMVCCGNIFSRRWSTSSSLKVMNPDWTADVANCVPVFWN